MIILHSFHSLKILELDHALNIWLLPEPTSLADTLPFIYFSQDKPLFSTAQIHSARVVSIYWFGSACGNALRLTNGHACSGCLMTL